MALKQRRGLLEARKAAGQALCRTTPLTLGGGWLVCHGLCCSGRRCGCGRHVLDGQRLLHPCRARTGRDRLMSALLPRHGVGGQSCTTPPAIANHRPTFQAPLPMPHAAASWVPPWLLPPWPQPLLQPLLPMRLLPLLWQTPPWPRLPQPRPPPPVVPLQIRPPPASASCPCRPAGQCGQWQWWRPGGNRVSGH